MSNGNICEENIVSETDLGAKLDKLIKELEEEMKKLEKLY